MRIVRTRRYVRDLKTLGLSSYDIAALEGAIVSDPFAGSVIPGLNGIRKIRFKVGS